MEKPGNSGLILIIIELVDKFIRLGFEYLTNIQLVKAKDTAAKGINLAVWFLLIWLLGSCSWFCLNGLCFFYLQSLGFAPEVIILILMGVNLLLLIIVLVGFIHAKKRLFDGAK